MVQNILLIVCTVIFVLGLFSFLIGSYIYKRKHNLPTGECSYCHQSKNRLLKDYYKAYPKSK